MKVVVTGRGTSGSFIIRGEQLGHSIGATVQRDALDIAAYDLAILVKRPSNGLIERIKRAGVPLVWDLVDSWPQPYGNLWERENCMQWLREQVAQYRPAGIVAATSAMADDCRAFGIPVLWLPHHANPAQRRNPIREKVAIVGYQGGVAYLGRWQGILERACVARGWRFEPQVDQLADADIIVALREASGYGPRYWKSNVKLANAQGSGTPFIGSPEQGYQETACGAEFWVESASELEAAFDALESHTARKAISEQLLRNTRTLEATALEYKTWLQSKF